MKNKKLIALLMCAAMSLATAVGCGDSSEDSSSKESSIPASNQASSEVVESSEEIPASSEEAIDARHYHRSSHLRRHYDSRILRSARIPRISDKIKSKR